MKYSIISLWFFIITLFFSANAFPTIESSFFKNGFSVEQNYVDNNFDYFCNRAKEVYLLKYYMTFSVESKTKILLKRNEPTVYNYNVLRYDKINQLTQ